MGIWLRLKELLKPKKLMKKRRRYWTCQTFCPKLSSPIIFSCQTKRRENCFKYMQNDLLLNCLQECRLCLMAAKIMFFHLITNRTRRSIPIYHKVSYKLMKPSFLEKMTIIFELFDILVKFIDPKHDSMDISDENIKCFELCNKPR
jgi:hypothetical protein